MPAHTVPLTCKCWRDAEALAQKHRVTPWPWPACPTATPKEHAFVRHKTIFGIGDGGLVCYTMPGNCTCKDRRSARKHSRKQRALTSATPSKKRARPPQPAFDRKTLCSTVHFQSTMGGSKTSRGPRRQQYASINSCNPPDARFPEATATLTHAPSLEKTTFRQPNNSDHHCRRQENPGFVVSHVEPTPASPPPP